MPHIHHVICPIYTTLYACSTPSHVAINWVLDIAYGTAPAARRRPPSLLYNKLYSSNFTTHTGMQYVEENSKKSIKKCSGWCPRSSSC